MPRSVRAADCIVNTFSTNLSNQCSSIWISDALLTETFYTFCRTPRRYGSHVPGPLEARRRASKRKNTSLAYASNGHPAYDPAVMLGSGSKEQWWKRAEDSTALPNRRSLLSQDQNLETNPLLPSWLFNTPDPPYPSASALQETTGSLVEPSPQTQTHATKTSRQDLTSKLARAVSLASVRDVVNTMHIDLRQNPKLCNPVFCRLIEIYGSTGQYSRLAPILCDPTLNPPGSSNPLLLIRHLCSGHTPRKSWDLFIFPALLKAVGLGLVPIRDLQDIILSIPAIHRTITASQPDHKVHAEWHRLLTVIEQSRVLHIHDFEPRFLSSWYTMINNASQTDTTCILLWRLRRCSALSELELASTLTARWLHDLVQVDETASSKFVDWLAALPLELQGPVIVQSTFRMLIPARNKDDLIARNTLERWSQILPQLYSSGKSWDFPINKSSWSQASYPSCELTAPQQLLTVIWIATRLWAFTADSTARFKNLGVRDQFEQTFTNMEGADQFDHVGRIVLVADTLPLPHKDKIFAYLQYFSNQQLIRMLGHERYRDGLKACFRLEYANLQDNAFTSRARRKFPRVLTTLSETINTDLDQFKAMSQTLILKSSQYFRIVTRLLDYNMELKFALAKAWPNALAARGPRKTPSDLDPGSVLTMIEKLIMTFAVTPVVTPRSAFRHVYKMYLFLHKVGAPINPVVARALWHTGVTRYGQTSASKRQVMWCLSKVQEIEGKQVAERLLWSAGFRRTFIQDFIHLLKEEIPPPELPGELEQADQDTPEQVQEPIKRPP